MAKTAGSNEAKIVELLNEWASATREGRLDLQSLAATAGDDIAFAHCLIQCGGKLPDGKVFDDLVRATICLRKSRDSWKVVHQHISKPFQNASA